MLGASVCQRSFPDRASSEKTCRSVWVAPETNTRAPQTMGELLPGSGMGVFQRTFLPTGTSHVSGTFSVGRNAGPVGTAKPGPGGVELFVGSDVGRRCSAGRCFRSGGDSRGLIRSLGTLRVSGAAASVRSK